MRRISRVEYNNMVRDLLGDTTQPATAFAPESPMTNGVNFLNNTYAGVSELIAQQYIQAAETLAYAATSNTTALGSLLTNNGCTTQDDTCAKAFIASFASRAFRGQLDDTESTSLFTLYSTVKGQFDFPTGIQAIVEAVLESPRFLYVVELGDGMPSGKVVALSQYEIAGRLALFLWRSVPDATLMRAAGANQLSTPAQIQMHATRMIADAKATDALNDFTTQWAQLQGTANEGKDSQFMVWNKYPKIGQEMVDETLTNVSQLVLVANGDLPTLLTSPASYINSDLAGFYGVTVPTGGTAVILTDPSLPMGQNTYTQATLTNRAGILTNGSIMATQAHTTLPSSVLRGKIVRENVLCDVMPPPPVGVVIPPPPSAPNDAGTTRDLFVAHETKTGCVVCHKFMDPIGFGFMHFDASGAYQATDSNGITAANGVISPPTFPPIDDSGQINMMNPGELQATFTNLNDFTTQLAGATQTHQCFALQELRYALSRMETPSDACSAGQIYGAFTAGKLNIQQLLLGVVTSDAFRYRSTELAGSACR
jgi:hypothetical protein